MERINKVNENYILVWIQSESPSLHDIVLQNGKKVEHNETEYNELSQKAIREEKGFKVCVEKGCLKVLKSKDNSWWIMSNFKEKDQVGRRIAFSAKIKAESSEECFNLLMDNIKLCNYHLIENDIEILQKLDTDKNVIVGFLILILGVLAIIKIIHQIF